MLLKVLIYCYLTGCYSSRQIAKQCREKVQRINIRLCGKAR
ncbi:transposase [Treponema vincentii]|nr:transposase [Treponema vincentii]